VSTRPRTDDRVVRSVASRLAAAGVPSPDVDARMLVEHVVEVFGAPAGCGGALLDGLVSRRAAREPLQVILGRTWFRTVELVCAPGVFVPRPETEIVAGVAIDAARAVGPGARVVEPCTGGGAIVSSLVSEVPGVEVVATERDPDAAELAATNLARALAGAADPDGPAVGAAGEVRLGDLLAPVDPGWRGTVDVLVANPPYLPAGDRGSWAAEVGDHDPDAALVAGPDGHEIVDRLLVAAATWLRPGGTVVVEIDDRRGDDALAAAAAAGLAEAQLVRDLTGRDRAVRAVRSR
jgi:release factor glutamine methyltransferase